jgi:hypothetical protein
MLVLSLFWIVVGVVLGALANGALWGLRARHRGLARDAQHAGHPSALTAAGPYRATAC